MPVYDVLSYFDGTSWNVIIDNTEKGDLENAIHLKYVRGFYHRLAKWRFFAFVTTWLYPFSL